MSKLAAGTRSPDALGDSLAAELQAYNHAFSELELPWQWDAATFRGLLGAAAGADCVGTYVERDQPHLLRVYEKAFLRDLVLATKARYHGPSAA